MPKTPQMPQQPAVDPLKERIDTLTGGDQKTTPVRKEDS